METESGKQERGCERDGEKGEMLNRKEGCGRKGRGRWKSSGRENLRSKEQANKTGSERWTSGEDRIWMGIMGESFW